MLYNELAQVLEETDPNTQKLYQLSDLRFLDFNQEGTAMMEDGIIVESDVCAQCSFSHHFHSSLYTISWCVCVCVCLFFDFVFILCNVMLPYHTYHRYVNTSNGLVYEVD